jgi:hypothetical protein
METPGKESDQLPEEGPEDYVPEDTGEEARDEAQENAGVRDSPGHATGHPDNAG